MTYSYLLVEGQADLAVVGRLLKLDGLENIRLVENLDPFWTSRLIPDKYPHKGNIVERVPVPAFFQSATHSVAIQAESLSEIPGTLRDSLSQLGASRSQLSGIGLVVDADFDSEIPPVGRFENIVADTTDSEIVWPDAPGMVSGGSPRTGIYVLPNNRDSGTVETLLDYGITTVWPEIARLAREYVVSATPEIEKLEQRDRREFQKPPGRIKAAISSIASLHRPTYAIQNSIRDGPWISEASLAAVEELRQLQAFLRAIVGA